MEEGADKRWAFLIYNSNSPTSCGGASSSALVVNAPTVKAEEEDLYATFKRLYSAHMFDEPKSKPFFEGLTPDEQRKCIESLRIYLRCERWQDRKGRWIPLASNWLKSLRWVFP